MCETVNIVNPLVAEQTAATIVIDDPHQQQDTEPSQTKGLVSEYQQAATEESPTEEVSYFRTLGACLQLTGLALSIAIIVLSSIHSTMTMRTLYDDRAVFSKFVGVFQLIFSLAILATTLQGSLQQNFPTPNMTLGISHAILAIFLFAAGINEAVYDHGKMGIEEPVPPSSGYGDYVSDQRELLSFSFRINCIWIFEMRGWGLAGLSSALMFIDFLATGLISVFNCLGGKFPKLDILNQDIFPKPAESDSHYDGPDSSNSIKLDFLRTLSGFLNVVQIIFACGLLISAALFSDMFYMQAGYFSFVATLQLITCVLLLVSFISNTAHYAKNFRKTIAICFGLVWVNLFVSILVSALYSERINVVDGSLDSFSIRIDGSKLPPRFKSIYAIVILSCVDFVFCTFSTYFWILFALHSNLGYGSKFYFGSKTQDEEPIPGDTGANEQSNRNLLPFLLNPTTLLKIVQIILSVALLICLSLLHKYINGLYNFLGTHIHVGYWNFIVIIHVVFVVVILMAKYFKHFTKIGFIVVYAFILLNLLICGITAACYAAGAINDHLFVGNGEDNAGGSMNVLVNTILDGVEGVDEKKDYRSNKDDSYIATCVLFFLQFVVTLVDLVLNLLEKQKLTGLTDSEPTTHPTN